MKLHSTIYKEQQEVRDIKSIVEVYQEIAAMHVQNVKGSIINSRQYYESLVLLVREVRPWLRFRAAKERNKKHNTLSNNDSTTTKTAVFFSANSGFYGDILERICREYISYIEREHIEPVVVGIVGKRLIEVLTGKPVKNFFPCDDTHPTQEQIANIVAYCQQFDAVEVFHGRFINLVSQVPHHSSLTGESMMETAAGEHVEKPIVFYLFEPTAQEIAAVVEGEIMASVIEQTLHESNFSKFASRMIHLDQALENISLRLDRIDMDQRRFSRRIENKKQLSRFSGRALWQQ